MAAEVDRARTLLGVDVLDSFTLHRDDTEIPVESFAEALLAQVERGAIASFGVSNWTFARFEELQSALGVDAPRLTIFSNHYSLADMVSPTWPGTLAMSQDELSALDGAGVTAIAWAALAAGFFAGRDVAELGGRREPRTAQARAGARRPPRRLDTGDRARLRALAGAAAVGGGRHALARAPRGAARGARLDLTPGDLGWLRHG